MVKNIGDSIPFALIVLLSVMNVFIILRDFLFHEGIVLYRDLYWPVTSEYFRSIGMYTWNPYMQEPSLVFAMQAPMHVFLSLFSPELGERLIYIIIIVSLTAIPFYVIYKLSGSKVAATITSILYVYNPVTINRFQHKFMLFTYSMLPLIALLAYKFSHDSLKNGKFKFKYLIASSVILMLISCSLHFAVFGIILFIFYAFSYSLFNLRRNYRLLSLFAKITIGIVVVIIIYTALEAFALLPVVMKFIQGDRLTPYLVNIEMVYHLSRNSHIVNTIRLLGYWWPSLAYESYPEVASYTLFIYPIIAAISLLVKARNSLIEKFKLLTSIIMLVSLTLACGTQTLGMLYAYLVTKLPFGWLIRDPYKFSFILSYSYSVLIGLLISNIRRRPRLLSILTIATVAVVFIGNVPLLSGNLNGVFRPSTIFEESAKTITNIDICGENDYSKYLLFPRYPIWYGTIPLTKDDVYAKYIIEKSLDSVNDVRKLLCAIGVKRVLLRKSILSNEVELIGLRKNLVLVPDLVRHLNEYKDFKKVYEDETMVMYILDCINFSYVYIPPVTLSGEGLDHLSSIAFIERAWSDIAYLPLDIVYTQLPIVKNISNTLILYLSSPSESAINTIILSPFKKSLHHEPSKYWSRASTTDPLHGAWHPYLKTLDIENWQFDYGYGLVFTWARSHVPSTLYFSDSVFDYVPSSSRITLDMPFDVPRSGKYKLFMRYFENQKGGVIRIYLDDKLISEISTVSQLNRFVWRDLGMFNFEVGRHVLILENVEGFNAVNIFVLIPVDEYDKLVEEFEESLENKIIIYLFEAESNMFREKARIVENINASNGEMLYLESGGYAWQRFEIVKNGYYMIALRLNDSARIMISNNSFTISSGDLGFYYLGPIYLEKGNHTIRVEALKRPLYLDVVWIYPTKSSSYRMTIEDLFKVKEEPARVIRYERVDPTLWRAEVIAKRPFMLIFAEAYDSLWEARVYRDGRLIEKVRSIPVYGVINGFWINETGNLTIIIRYVPQDWFELGLKISATTFTLCIFYLIWDWRRSRGDRWALGLEKVFRRALTLARK